MQEHRHGRRLIGLTAMCGLIFGSSLGPASARAAQDAAHFPGSTWQKVAKAEELGYSSEKLKEARAYSETLDTAAVMIVVDGQLLDAWGDNERKFSCHSMRKSYLSVLFGPHVRAGRIDLSKTLGELGIDDKEGLTDTEKKATIGDMIRARSGVYHPATAETAAMRAAKPARGSHPPGTNFYYNNWDFNALGSIFRKLTGADIFEEFKTRIADPTQMEDYRVEDGRYSLGRQSDHPAYPFRMSGRDLARFGLLCLRKGNWNGKQLIPADWMEESTRSYSHAISHNDGSDVGGYGYMWWVAVDGNHYANVKLPDGSYSARGVGGHCIVVIPAYDMVVVHRVNTFQRGNAVSGGEMGTLLKKILNAKMN